VTEKGKRYRCNGKKFDAAEEYYARALAIFIRLKDVHTANIVKHNRS